MYPPIEPSARGHMQVGGGHQVYWESVGNPSGKPALVVHGGPGSGAPPWWRQLFDPARYRVVLFDQRNCGRSTPHASTPALELSANTTHHLIDDIEQLRQEQHIDQWLVLGGSWGSTLSLAYAEAQPEHVSELILFGVTTGRHSEFDWAFRGGLSLFFPAEWQRLLTALPEAERHSRDIVEAFAERLQNPDPAIHRPAADAWCLWESATPSWPPTQGLAERFKEPGYALTFARIVTHYASHNAWLEDNVLIDHIGRIATKPGVLVNGRFDFGAPLANAWTLHQAWPKADLVVVDNAGHSADERITDVLIAATDRFAAR